MYMVLNEKPDCCMRTHRPACTSVESAFIIPYLVNTIVQLAPFKISIFKLMCVAEQAGVGLYLVSNSEERFSCVVAHTF